MPAGEADTVFEDETSSGIVLTVEQQTYVIDPVAYAWKVNAAIREMANQMHLTIQEEPHAAPVHDNHETANKDKGKKRRPLNFLHASRIRCRDQHRDYCCKRNF